MAFDRLGRLCVGMGPQYRNPTPDTPGDSVVLVLDTDGDGRADRTKVLATGFNAIQGLAWHGRDLWVANAPDLTVVRDVDGDDVADEYVRVYTDLGNLEHGLHGLTWGPDGWLYMSKGNSKGLTEPGRMAPKPFRDLWGVEAPAGTPDFPPPVTVRAADYRHAYQDPADDWGREGGVLRCEAGGRNLEIVARGFRNPWDIAYDDGFNWLGTDNDQTSGDRVFMPFYGAHFGWNHPWYAQWADAPEAPTAPVSGPLFEGSGTGIVFGNSPRFPLSHRGVFFINDWLGKSTFIWRPRWEGALQRPEGGRWEPFVVGGNALFRPTDLEFGPDGALWILGWGSGYGAEYREGQLANEGRIFRVTWNGAGPEKSSAPPGNALGQRTVEDLVAAFDGPLPIWRVDAQEELVRRGAAVKDALQSRLTGPGLSTARETWAVWALGRMPSSGLADDAWFVERLMAPEGSLNLRIQCVRILARRARAAGRNLPASVVGALGHVEPRMRFAAVEAVGLAGGAEAVAALWDLTAVELDRTIYYAAWQMLRRKVRTAELRARLVGSGADVRAGARRAAILALLEDSALSGAEVEALSHDPAIGVREAALRWMVRNGAGAEQLVVRGRPLQPGRSPQETRAPVPADPAAGGRTSPASLVWNLRALSPGRYVAVPGGLHAGAKCYTDRSYPLREVPASLTGLEFIQTANEDDNSSGREFLSFETVMPVRVFVGLDARQRETPEWVQRNFAKDARRIVADHWSFDLYACEFPAGVVVLGGNTQNGRLGGKGNYIVVLEPLPLTPPVSPTTAAQVMALIPAGNSARGAWLFHDRAGAGCFNCHQLSAHGNAFGPDLSALGARATPPHIVASMLDPNAVITEGFNLHTIQTSDGEQSGVLLEESGLAVTLGLADGSRRRIPKRDIVRRTVEKRSAMPAFDLALSATNVADLTAYLMTQRPPATENAAAPAPQPEPPRATIPAALAELSVSQSPGSVSVTRSGRPVAEFHYLDQAILRPYLANVHTPDGFKVTRNHPPVGGVDSTDHDTMHPGIWLGFGDVSGVDFWRNRGRVEHLRFRVAPEVRDGRVRWVQDAVMRAPDGRTVGFVTNLLELGSLTPVGRGDARAGSAGWLVTWEAVFRADVADIVFGDQEEMGFGARVATAITEKNGGRITTSEGRVSARETWGRPAEWCDYSGAVAGRHVGIVLLGDPGNFRPSWWHNRDYGVFVANPFGREAMQQGPKSAVTVRQGETFRVRFGAIVYNRAGDGDLAGFIRAVEPLVFRRVAGW